jgi:hypothetical protein
MFARSLILTGLLAALAVSAVPSPSSAEEVIAERVTGGTLDLVWVPAFGFTLPMVGETLDPDHPAYDNPSGDHTVAVLTNTIPDKGGLGLNATDPGAVSDYIWEGWVFLGDGETRRGIVLRADPASLFSRSYQFVIEPGLFQLLFRLNEGEGAVQTLGEWVTTDTPGGFPEPNTWHHMKVEADGPSFRVYWDGFELTDAPIVNEALPSGWVGTYNFRFDLGGVPVYFDDLVLSTLTATPTRTLSWGSIKHTFGDR